MTAPSLKTYKHIFMSIFVFLQPKISLPGKNMAQAFRVCLPAKAAGR
jgi:hypothetical protein